jgi:hypothetical protein
MVQNSPKHAESYGRICFGCTPDGSKEYMEVLIGNVDELALEAMVKISKAQDSVREKTEVCTTHPSAPEAMVKLDTDKGPKRDEADFCTISDCAGGYTQNS